MRKILFRLSIIALFFIAFNENANSQCVKKDGFWVLPDGTPCPNTILTAVPFLRIVSDARSGALGDAGIAISPDANAIGHNASKLVFAKQDLGISATYTPWLRALGLTDVYLAYLTGFYKIDKLQSVGMGLRFFSLGSIPFTDTEGNSIGTGKPSEFELKASYARKLSENFSAAIGLKFIYSNLAKGQIVEGVSIEAGKAGAADFSFTYNKPIKSVANGSNLTLGLAFTNIGSKITYSAQANKAKDYLPANMGFGAAYKVDIDDFNSITLIADVNKLLVPSPIHPNDSLNYDIDPADGIPDFKQYSPVEAVFKSFGDAPNGFSEELEELMYSVGVEYWYDEQFAVRAGYYSESKNKGARKFFTVGVGLKYNIFGLNFSYLVPTSNQHNPLDNTLRFSLVFDFQALAEE